MLVVTIGHTYLNKTGGSELNVYWSMYDLLLPPSIKELKGVLKIFKKQSDKIKSVPLALFFEKAVQKIFGKS